MKQRKILALLLAAMMAVAALSGCGSSNQAADTAGTGTSTQAEASDSTAAPDAGEPEAVTWPTGTIQIDVGYTAGGMSDLHARVVSDALQRITGESVIVTNQDSSPYIAYEAVRNGSLEGTELLSAHLGMVTAYYLGLYDYLITEDFTVIAFMQNQGDNVFAVRADSEWENLNDLVAAAQAAPETVLAGISASSFSQLLFQKLEEQGDCTLKLVDGGSDTEKLQNLLGGNLDIVILSAATANQYVESGDIKVLAAITDGTNDKYSTTAEQGFDMAWDNGMFILGPAGMDPELVDAINGQLKLVAEDASAQETVTNLGGEMEWMNAADSQARAEKRVEEIRAMVDASGLNVR